MWTGQLIDIVIVSARHLRVRDMYRGRGRASKYGHVTFPSVRSSLGHLWNSKNSNSVLNIKANRIRCLSSKTGANSQSSKNFTLRDSRIPVSLHSLLSFGGKEL